MDKIYIMKINISKVDRIVRILIAIVANVLFITQTVTGILSYIVLAVGGIALVTSLLNFCPIYKVLKVSSIQKD